MKHLFKSALLFCIGLLMFACANDDNEPYGPDYEITGIGLKVLDRDYYRDTIPANVFKLGLILMSDNDYAQKYGINPKLKSNISGLKVFMENYEDLSLLNNSDVSKYFVVEDGSDYNSLYETFEQYIAKKKILSLTPSLVFINQTALVPKPDKLINDTISVELRVQLTLGNNDVFSKQIKTVLIP